MTHETDEIDRRLREVYSLEEVDSADVGFAIRMEIRRHERQGLVRRFAIAAALLTAVALGGYWRVRTKAASGIFAAVALDHHTEVVQNAPRHWRITDADLDILTTRFGLTRQRIGFSGYRFMRAKICLLDGRRVLHLVYNDGKADYSLFIEPVGAAAPFGEAQYGTEHVAGFHGNRIEGVVVGEGTAADCRRFLKTVTGT